MSVLIKGMTMPTSCINCPLLGTLFDCRVIEDSEIPELLGERRPDCPLVPVPPHGRLIDADALTKMCQEMQRIEWNNKAYPYSWAYAYESFEGDIDNAPTIIPAEEGE